MTWSHLTFIPKSLDNNNSPGSTNNMLLLCSNDECNEHASVRRFVSSHASHSRICTPSFPTDTFVLGTIIRQKLPTFSPDTMSWAGPGRALSHQRTCLYLMISRPPEAQKKQDEIGHRERQDRSSRIWRRSKMTHDPIT